MLRVDGDASNNWLMMLMQADLLQVPVQRPAYMETTAIGAPYAAGAHLVAFCITLNARSCHERCVISQYEVIMQDVTQREPYDALLESHQSLMMYCARIS